MKCHAGRLLCQKPGYNPDFQVTLLLALQCGIRYYSPTYWYTRRSSALLNELEMEGGRQLNSLLK